MMQILSIFICFMDLKQVIELQPNNHVQKGFNSAPFFHKFEKKTPSYHTDFKLNISYRNLKVLH